jgi:hypothetical protein
MLFAWQHHALSKLSVLLLILASSCSDGLDPPPIDPCADDQQVTVSVSEDPVPLSS